MDAVLAPLDAAAPALTRKYVTICGVQTDNMAVKIAAFLITLLINIVVGVAIFFFMLLAMNGFSESDAIYGLGTYIVLAIFVSLLMGGGAAVAVHVLMKRHFRAAVAALIAIPIFSVVGAGLKIVCSIVGVLIADYVRVNY